MIAVVRVQIRPSSLRETAEAHFVKKMERSDRGEYCPLYRYLPVLTLDAQELQQGFNMERIYRATDSHHPRKHVYHPSLVGVVTQGLLKRTVCVLFSHGCSKQLGRMHIRWAAKVYNSNLFVCFRYQEPCRLPN
jgi:hypothetical protein